MSYSDKLKELRELEKQNLELKNIMSELYTELNSQDLNQSKDTKN
jgi:hypothetical protein